VHHLDPSDWDWFLNQLSAVLRDGGMLYSREPNTRVHRWLLKLGDGWLKVPVLGPRLATVRGERALLSNMDEYWSYVVPARHGFRILERFWSLDSDVMVMRNVKETR